MKALLAATIQKLKEAPAPRAPTAFVGFDGYVDKIQFPVQKSDPSEQVFFPSIADFSHHLAKIAGKSGQIELVTQLVKPGGNGPLMAAALARLGYLSNCIGTMGWPDIHPAFLEIQKQCNILSLGPPAETNAFEFGDGKLILSELSTFKMLTWDSIKTNAEHLRWLQQHVESSQLVALVDWVNLPHATAIWRGMLEEVLPQLTHTKRTYFFDLCDPGKRTAAEIVEVLQLIGRFQAFGRVVLGMNENETVQIYETLFNEFTSIHPADDPLRAAAADIFETLSIDVLLVHPNDRALVVTQTETTEISGRWVHQPKVLTGAGDHLNAGFSLGLLRGYDMPTNLILAMAASGAYITTGTAPDLAGLLQYLQNWLTEIKA